jgi:hypothetical protein
MRDFHIRDRVTFFGRAYLVRGFSPMSVTRPSVQLEDAQTGEQREVAIDELTGKVPPVDFFGAEDDAK